MAVHSRLSKDHQGFKASHDDTVIHRPAWGTWDFISKKKKRKEERKSHAMNWERELNKNILASQNKWANTPNWERVQHFLFFISNFQVALLPWLFIDRKWKADSRTVVLQLLTVDTHHNVLHCSNTLCFSSHVVHKHWKMTACGSKALSFWKSHITKQC